MCEPTTGVALHVIQSFVSGYVLCVMCNQNSMKYRITNKTDIINNLVQHLSIHINYRLSNLEAQKACGEMFIIEMRDIY